MSKKNGELLEYVEKEEKREEKSLFKKFKENSEITALLTIFAGLILVIFPRLTASLIGYLIGTIAIIAGLIFVAKYFKKDINLSYYSHELASGISLIIVGIVVYIKVDVLINFFQPVLALIVLYSGVLKLQTAIDLYRLKFFKEFRVVLILSGINIVFAIILLLNPGFLAKFSLILIGIALIYSGVASLFASHFMQKGVMKNKKNDII